MNSAIEELEVENNSELQELKHLFSWAAQVGGGENLPEEFVYFEDIDDNPMLVRRSSVTSIHHSGSCSMTYITLGGQQIAVQGSYEATIAKVLEPKFRSP